MCVNFLIVTPITLSLQLYEIYRKDKVSDFWQGIRPSDMNASISAAEDDSSVAEMDKKYDSLIDENDEDGGGCTIDCSTDSTDSTDNFVLRKHLEDGFLDFQASECRYRSSGHCQEQAEGEQGGHTVSKRG